MVGSKQMDSPLLQVENLWVEFANTAGRQTILKGVDLIVNPGEILGLVGESGCGKSVLARTLVRLEPPARVTAGSIKLCGEELCGQSRANIKKLRGSRISLVMQNPRSAMDPLFTMNSQLREVLAFTNQNGRKRLEKKWSENLDRRLVAAGIASPKLRRRQYPHQWSRGMLQRAQLLMGFAPKPQVVILDEVTSALDPTIAVQMIHLIRRLKEDGNTGIIFITHDVAVAFELCHRIAVMKKGAVIECGLTRNIVEHPLHPYTRRLFADFAHHAEKTDVNAPVLQTGAIISTRKLGVRFAIGSILGFRRKYFYALKDISLDILRKGIFCLVGESGSGKTTLMNAVLGLIPFQKGELIVDRRPVQHRRDPVYNKLKSRWQVVFQDPVAALNPYLTLAQSIAEPLKAKGADKETIKKTTEKVALEVGLSQELLNRRPGQASVGQNQRACIARALCVDPEFLFLDEPLSALDAIHRGKMAELLQRLTDQRGLTCFLISHDFRLVKRIGTHVAVMYLGQIVEQAPAKEFFSNPIHPYSKALLSNALQPGIWENEQIVLSGEIPSPHVSLEGCIFHTRCPQALPICSQKPPPLIQADSRHEVHCHLQQKN